MTIISGIKNTALLGGGGGKAMLLARQVRSAQGHTNDYLPTLTMTSAIALCTVFTSLNSSLASDSARQSVLAAAFCVIACVLYIGYMVVSRAVLCVLSHIEHGYEEVPDDEDNVLLLSRQPETHEHHHQGPGNHHDNSSWSSSSSGASSGIARQLMRIGSSSSRHEQHALAAMHREAVISSIYLGGSGAFLALPALCMWDMSVSVCFAMSIALVGMLMQDSKVVDFKPNVDTATAISRLHRLRWALNGCIAHTLLLVAWQDVHGTRFDHTYAYYSYVQPGQDSTTTTTTAAAMNSSLSSTAVDEPYNTPGNINNNVNNLLMREAAYDDVRGLLQWPLMLLAAASPLLMHLGTTGARTQPLSKMLMTPSQTLEAGLPVSTVLAILVLCWYSPVDALIMRDQLFNRLAIPMLVLCPCCLAAVLALVMRGFRKGRSTPVAAVLACACAVRQQAVDRHILTTVDKAVVAAAVGTFCMWLALMWFSAKYVAEDNHHRRCKNNNEGHSSSGYHYASSGNNNNNNNTHQQSGCHGSPTITTTALEAEGPPGATTTAGGGRIAEREDDEDYNSAMFPARDSVLDDDYDDEEEVAQV